MGYRVQAMGYRIWDMEYGVEDGPQQQIPVAEQAVP